MAEITRHRLLQLAALGLTSTVLAGCSLAAETPTATPIGAPRTTAPPLPPPSPTQAGPMPLAGGRSVAITPVGEFFAVAISQRHNWLTPSGYSLAVTGAVEQTLSLTLDQIKALPAVETMRTLECIGNPIGGELIGNAVWKGARLADILKEAGLRSQAIELRITSADGYSTSIPTSLATDPDSLLAYDMNGAPLPDKHGAPLRALFPGRYGMKMPKWITRLEAITEPYLGHWEKQGWSNDAFIRVHTHIRTPQRWAVLASGEYIISGLAFSGISGVAKVELSTDGGAAWSAASLVRGPSPLVWTEWRLQWQAMPGSTTIIARATDNDGVRQPLSVDERPAGDDTLEGNWVVHRIQVSVEQPSR